MRYRHLMAAAALALAATPAFAVFKCKETTGRTVFQEFPCEATGARGEQIEVRPAAGNLSPAAAASAQAARASAAAGTGQTEAQRLRALNERDAKEKKLKNLNEQEIPAAQGRVRVASVRCKENMASVGSQKARANNNLAGAVWEQSISAEMQAIATQCSAEQTRLNAELDRLITEKRMLEQELAK